MATTGTFSTLLHCMDGRCQEKGLAYAKNLFGTDYADSITEPGIDGILAGSHSVLTDAQDLVEAAEWIKRKADISANGHGSKKVLILGHCSCAGNQVGYEEHVAHVQKAMTAVGEWGMFDEIHGGVFNDEWEIQEVK